MTSTRRPIDLTAERSTRFQPGLPSRPPIAMLNLPSLRAAAADRAVVHHLAAALADMRPMATVTAK